MKKLIGTFFILLTALAATAQSVVSEGFSPKSVRAGVPASYRIVLKNTSGKINPSDIPLPSGLAFVGSSTSSNISVVNGDVNRQIVYNFTVVAQSDGSYTIPAWKISANGKTFDIPAATLEVSQSAPAPTARQNPYSRIVRSAPNQNHSYDTSLKNAIKLELKLPREKIYVGETIKCELILSVDKSIFERGYRLRRAVPEIKNVDAFECPAFTTDPTVDMQRDPDHALVIYQTVITPLKVGTYDLDFSMKGILGREMSIDELMNMSMFERMANFGSGANMPFEISMPARKLEILPLPQEGKPVHFTGAIGKFALGEVSVSPDSLSVGEPCTITVKIAGSGNFSRISAPALDDGGNWKIYKPKSSFIDESNSQGYIGFKTFEYTAVPKSADLPTAPRVDFNYFDPETGKYISKQSKPVAVSVAPSIRAKSAGTTTNAEAEKPPAAPFSQIAEGVPAKGSADIFGSAWFWAVQALVLAAFAVFVCARIKAKKLESDPAYVKRISCAAKARAFAKSAQAQTGDAKRFFADARESLRYALAATTTLEADAFSEADALAAAERLGLSQAQCGLVKTLFSGADALEYGGANLADFDIQKLAADLSQTVSVIIKDNEKYAKNL